MRDLIVRTAADLIEKKSCDISLDEVAAIAGILRSHVERYFQSVDEIVRAVAEDQAHVSEHARRRTRYALLCLHEVNLESAPAEGYEPTHLWCSTCNANRAVLADIDPDDETATLL